MSSTAPMQSTASALPGRPHTAGSRPWLALALTFLFLGIGYALPFQLSPGPPAGLWQGAIAPEVLNLYALTVFAGWAHFFYAWRGQLQGTMRLPLRWRTAFWFSAAAAIAILASARALVGVGIFSALVWIWFIAHFVKAERVFARPSISATQPSVIPPPNPPISWQPVAAFAWLTLVLFNVAGLQDRHWLLFTGSTALGALILLTGGWKTLARGASFLPALALFFDGEAMVWGTYGHWMHPAFRVGVYVFHVAGASFFHYLGSYAYGQSRSLGDRWLGIAAIVAVNLACIGLCAGAAWLPSLNWLSPLIGLEWFTLWVAAHLAASDLLPVCKRLSARR